MHRLSFDREPLAERKRQLSSNLRVPLTGHAPGDAECVPDFRVSICAESK
jgi:hypothetical protein